MSTAGNELAVSAYAQCSRNAEPSSARSAMVNGLATANLMLATLGSLELAVGHVARGIAAGVFVEVVFALALLHAGNRS